jgi:hypothetical protein
MWHECVLQGFICWELGPQCDDAGVGPLKGGASWEVLGYCLQKG